jgi:hypothetical protein
MTSFTAIFDRIALTAVTAAMLASLPVAAFMFVAPSL